MVKGTDFKFDDNALIIKNDHYPFSSLLDIHVHKMPVKDHLLRVTGVALVLAILGWFAFPAPYAALILFAAGLLVTPLVIWKYELRAQLRCEGREGDTGGQLVSIARGRRYSELQLFQKIATQVSEVLRK